MCLTDIRTLKEAKQDGFKMPKKLYKVMRRSYAIDVNGNKHKDLSHNQLQCFFAKQIVEINSWNEPESEPEPDPKWDEEVTRVFWDKSHVGYFSCYTQLKDAIEKCYCDCVIEEYDYDNVIVECQYRGLEFLGWNYGECVLVRRIKPVGVINHLGYELPLS
jgi:hypothetical protein